LFPHISEAGNLQISGGTGRNRLADMDDDKIITTRIGWKGEDINGGLAWTPPNSPGRLSCEERLFLALIVFFTSSTIFAEVCVWRNPERTMIKIFPEAGDYKTITNRNSYGN
jgi:hypothetical protein